MSEKAVTFGNCLLNPQQKSVYTNGTHTLESADQVKSDWFLHWDIIEQRF